MTTKAVHVEKDEQGAVIHWLIVLLFCFKRILFCCGQSMSKHVCLYIRLWILSYWGVGGDGAGVQGEAHVLGHGNKCTCYFHGGKTDS